MFAFRNFVLTDDSKLCNCRGVFDVTGKWELAQVWV